MILSCTNKFQEFQNIGGLALILESNHIFTMKEVSSFQLINASLKWVMKLSTGTQGKCRPVIGAPFSITFNKLSSIQIGRISLAVYNLNSSLIQCGERVLIINIILITKVGNALVKSCPNIYYLYA